MIILDFLRMIRFIHTLFALPFATSAVLMACEIQMNLNAPLIYLPPAIFNEQKLIPIILTLLVMIFARTAAMGFNRYIDAKIDALNPRTQHREIPKGKITKNQALVLTLLSALCYFICCIFYFHPTILLLSPLLLLLLFFYSYTKRFTVLCHWILGLVIGLSAMASEVAIFQTLSVVSILTSLSIMFWLAGSDILYAIADMDFDRKEKLKSIPAKFGLNGALGIALINYTITITLWSLIYIQFSFVFFIIVIIFLALVLILQVILIYIKGPAQVQRFFTLSNSAVSVGFLAAVLGAMILG